MVQGESLEKYLDENYYVDDGMLVRKTAYKQWKAGQEVGRVGARGYKTLSVMGKRHYVHRLIYLIVKGACPEMLDHINGDKTDNRIENLRPCTKSENALNLHNPHKDNAAGVLGVTRRQGGNKFYARFKNEYLGSFDTAEEAHHAYLKAKFSSDEIST